MDKYITATEVAYRLGCSPQTLNTYYKFKEENPSNEYAHMLPDFVRIGKKRTRYWHEDDVAKIARFREAIPQGRNGLLGSVTQRFVKTSFRYHSDKKDSNNAQQPVARDKAVKVNGTMSYISRVEALLLGENVEPELVSYIRKQLEDEYEWRVMSAGKSA